MQSLRASCKRAKQSLKAGLLQALRAFAMTLTMTIRQRAQAIIEYVAIIMVVIAVFIAMGAYYKRSLQARYRQAGDVLGGGEQYTAVANAPAGK